MLRKSIYAPQIAAKHVKEIAVKTMTMLVAVYGTLKRGFSNHGLLQHSSFVGEDSLTCITLYDLGPYPGARLQDSDGIIVEVFEVDEQVMLLLDELEEYLAEAPEQGMYNRQQVSTRFGLAWIYLYNRQVDEASALRSGSWQAV